MMLQKCDSTRDCQFSITSSQTYSFYTAAATLPTLEQATPPKIPQMAADAAASEVTKKFRVYTRTGDDGTSCLYSGQRLSKDNAFFEALGDVDELNSSLGIAREHVRHIDAKLAEQLATIQSRLIDVGSALATPAHAASEHKVARTRFNPKHIATLEAWLDTMDDELPPLRHFILPSGGLAAVHLHLARSTARRAERSVVALHRFQQHLWSEGFVLQTATETDTGSSIVAAPEQQACDVVDPAVRMYLNRLSDYLFTAARFMKVLHPSFGAMGYFAGKYGEA